MKKILFKNKLGIAQEATGLGDLATSTKHIRQLPFFIFNLKKLEFFSFLNQQLKVFHDNKNVEHQYQQKHKLVKLYFQILLEPF